MKSAIIATRTATVADSVETFSETVGLEAAVGRYFI
jgi:hypothetical protein